MEREDRQIVGRLAQFGPAALYENAVQRCERGRGDEEREGGVSEEQYGGQGERQPGLAGGRGSRLWELRVLSISRRTSGGGAGGGCCWDGWRGEWKWIRTGRLPKYWKVDGFASV